MLVFDIETDNNEGAEYVTKIHVLATHDTETKENLVFSKGEVEKGLKVLSSSTCLCGHNVVGYDIPVIRRLYPGVTLPDSVVDTLVLGRLLLPDIKQVDIGLWKRGLLPGQFIGTHSLESYGYRLGILKGDFHKIANWSKWSPEMEAYCVQDVKVTAALVEKLLPMVKSQQSVDLEHAVARIIDRQIKHGFAFDTEKAEKLYATLIEKREEIGKQLRQAFGVWWVKEGKAPFVPKQDNKRMGYYKGCPLNKIKLVEFNPTSRHHIAHVLQTRYGWKPVQWNEDGTPTLDEKVIGALPYPEAPMLAEYLMISKRIGQLAEGKQAWLKVVQSDGRIHGNVNPCGAVTGRMIHYNPNIAQVPQVEAPYGKECRDLFHARKGYKIVGGDASGLELRCLGHYMAKWDNGEYIRAILEGDVHTVNQEAAGLPTRRIAKTFIYAFLYGAGDELLGTFLNGGKDTGRKLRNQFLRGLPALNSLLKAVQNAVATRGYLIGVDGRKLKVRSQHAALNVLLQSAGAIIMKQALVILDTKLLASGYKPGEDYEFVANIHDEFQLEVKEEYADAIGKMIPEAITEAGLSFNFRCPLTGEYKVGNTWAETH